VLPDPVVLVDGATRPELYPLSLHDALPISGQEPQVQPERPGLPCAMVFTLIGSLPGAPGSLATMIRAAHRRRRERNTSIGVSGRSEEHTSELQSRENGVCRLLLDEKHKGES